MQQLRRVSAGYVAALGAAAAVAVGIGWLPLAGAFDGYAYDWLFRLHPVPPSPARSVVLAIDESTLAATGGMRHVRRTLADTLRRLRSAQPKVVAIDIILADDGDPREDAELEAAMADTPNLVLAADLLEGGAWDTPIPRFARHAAGIGQVHANRDEGVCRELPLEKAGGRIRRWSLALEAYRLAQGGAPLDESPADLTVGGEVIPARRDKGRPMYVAYRREDAVPHITALELASDPGRAGVTRGKAVFVGITAQSAAHDRLDTPVGEMTGIDIHANAYETLASGLFRQRLSASFVLFECLLLAAAAGVVFAFLSGWPAYLAGAGLIAVSHIIPHLAFRFGVIVPYTAPVATAWLAVGSAAAWQYFVVRRQLRKSESDRARYQQAIHFVTHEMRSPLTAIQGSSELIGRYNLNDDKRKQVAETINAESKRLARMIQTFLDIERLTAGQMELRAEPIEIAGLITTCVARAQTLADRKGIRLGVGQVDSATLTGDRELMDYALYNLLTNAVKYSPANTNVAVEARLHSDTLRVAVHDQGIGMDAQELKNIFKKFYRTKKAEASGEAGTGIGLSLVEQIVIHHGGRMEVTSTPGKGSCFTMVLPRGVPRPLVPAANIAANQG